MMNNEIILSILVPTYNREKHLKKLLTTIFKQIDEEIKEKIEIIVSDNASIDETEIVLKKFENIAKIKKINFKFSKNERNLGPDNNFFKLVKQSKGKYCWILGDDEFLIENSLAEILEILSSPKQIGLLYISNENLKKSKEIYNKNETEKFLKKVNYIISFISANIFNKNKINLKINYEEFIGTNLIQEIFYFQSILNSEFNIYLNKKIFLTERADNVGNYKLFETFGKNQNKIFDFFKKEGLQETTIKSINKRMLREFFPIYIVNFSENGKWENENIYEEMKLVFSKYLEFWIFCVPLIKFPKVIKYVYFFGIRIFNKLVKIVRR